MLIQLLSIHLNAIIYTNINKVAHNTQTQFDCNALYEYGFLLNNLVLNDFLSSVELTITKNPRFYQK